MFMFMLFRMFTLHFLPHALSIRFPRLLPEHLLFLIRPPRSLPRHLLILNELQYPGRGGEGLNFFWRHGEESI